ncbi:SMI1/KNR4 family protein [Pseudomonas entomophila]|uniref:SMI1/KNR4 family protein n=1 Tax=Pseudomonas entomophila TaxID=312306 RepID=UPI0015E4513D|nr:SMI1/KNR4 family protein [Pseudomonas entomophila]MBA1188060.1 SMI1/KNR4 family protein [Pseudomonas entomophila]
MTWTESQKSEMLHELKGYEVYFTPADLPSGLEPPWQWRDFGPADGEKSCVPAEWANYAEQLPWVCAWIEQCVLGTVVAVKGKPYLMYVYSKEDELSFYIGGAPLGAGNAELGKCAHLPQQLRDFYRDLHDGFGFYIGCAMGPSHLEDFVSIKDLCDDDYPDLPDMVSFFSSGAGDYLALGEGAWAGQVFIWWHEKPDEPSRERNVWDIMDAWMSIFLECSDGNGLFEG